MKRRLVGCVALWMIAATAMAQNPGSNTGRKSNARTAPGPAARATHQPVIESRPAAVVQTPVEVAKERPASTEPAYEVQPSAMQTPMGMVITPEAMTPELYLYLQEQKRYDDPAQAVRRKAELKAAQRMSRMAAMKWFGMSNARPQVAAVPMMGVYSPAWVGNGYDRYDWVGGVYPSANIYIERDSVQR